MGAALMWFFLFSLVAGGFVGVYDALVGSFDEYTGVALGVWGFFALLCLADWHDRRQERAERLRRRGWDF